MANGPSLSSSHDRSRRLLAEFAGGSVGGMLQALAGHPLDTIKVRLQSEGSHFAGPVDCFRRTLREEGARGLYKGLSGPLLSNGVLNAFMFSVNGQMKRVVATAASTTVAQLSLSQICCAAWMTAPIYCLLLCPIDVVKARLQVQSAQVQHLYTGPLDVISQTLRSEGLLGLFRGYSATVLTRLIGSPVYFVSYEAVKRHLKPADGSSLSSMQIAFAGGVGGTMFWAANFPVDVIKTRLQTQRMESLSLVQTVVNVYRTLGLRGFYRGFTPCILRAAPANAICFWGVEKTLATLDMERF